MSHGTSKFSGWAPYIVGAIVVAMLASLGLWQTTRGLNKRAGLEAYNAEGGFERYYEDMAVRPFQQLRVSGRYDPDRQVLIDNMIVDGRNGHYVITPFDLGDDELLLVNRGWIEKDERRAIAAKIDLASRELTVHGRVAQLPRAGMRMGDAFAGNESWPKHAVYPDLDDMRVQLGKDVLPFVLLLDAEEPEGFKRAWEPQEMTASRHFGYAFQWFAMAAMLSGLLIWRFRRRLSKYRDDSGSN